MKIALEKKQKALHVASFPLFFTFQEFIPTSKEEKPLKECENKGLRT